MYALFLDGKIYVVFSYIKTASFLLKLYLLFISSALSNLAFSFIQKEINSAYLVSVFDRYYIKPLSCYYEASFKEIIKQKNLNYKSQHFKSFYLLDINKGKIILDWRLTKNKVAYQLKKNERLVAEWLFICYKLRESYNRDFGKKTNFKEASNRVYF